jgi:hypothetical protein
VRGPCFSGESGAGASWIRANVRPPLWTTRSRAPAPRRCTTSAYARTTLATTSTGPTSASALSPTAVAGMLVFDDEGYFDQQPYKGSWPKDVWRLYVGLAGLLRRGLLPESAPTPSGLPERDGSARGCLNARVPSRRVAFGRWLGYSDLHLRVRRVFPGRESARSSRPGDSAASPVLPVHIPAFVSPERVGP